MFKLNIKTNSKLMYLYLSLGDAGGLIFSGLFPIYLCTDMRVALVNLTFSQSIKLIQ